MSATVPMPAATTVYVSTREGTNTETMTFGLSETTPQEVRFGSIGFSQPGTYTYLIKEQPGKNNRGTVRIMSTIRPPTP